MNRFLVRAALAVILALPAAAQIRYTDILPDTLLMADLANPWAMYSIDLNADGTFDCTICQFHPSRDYDVAEMSCSQYGTCEILVNGVGTPRCLAKGSPINSAGTIWFNSGTTAMPMTDNWAGAQDGYLGARVRSGTGWLYGWIRLDVAANERTITLKDFACEMTLDKEILAGADGITGVAALSGGEKMQLRIAGTSLIIDRNDAKAPADWILSDLFGRRAAQGRFEHSSGRIDCGSFRTGVYFLRIREPGSAVTGKLLLGGGRIHGIVIR